MTALRIGRAGIRFLHSYPAARVSCRLTPVLALQASFQQPQSAYPFYATARGYADKPVSRPKQHTGRAPARKPRATAASKKADPKPKAAKTTTTTTATTKPKKKPAKKTAKKAAKKSAPKKKKKVLTPKQVERKAKLEKSAAIRELKGKSLKSDAPKTQTAQPWLVFYTEYVKSHSSSTSPITALAKEAGSAWKKCTPAEREHYNHVANQNKAANDEAIEKWTVSFPASRIKEANDARKKLNKLGVNGYTAQIKDPRQVKQPSSTFTLFSTERHGSGDFKHISVSEAAKLIGKEFKELPESELQRLREESNKRRAQYLREYKEAYGVDAPISKRKAAAS